MKHYTINKIDVAHKRVRAEPGVKVKAQTGASVGHR